MKKYLSIIICAAFMLTGCEKNKELDYIKTETVVIASEMNIRRNLFGTWENCLMAKYKGSDEWFRYDFVDGFEYVPEYEYVIRVSIFERKNPDIDASSLEYKLIQIISKVQKQSENLPPLPEQW